MSEDKFEEFLRKEAQAYNTPPASAPRDEMWAAIEAARSTPVPTPVHSTPARSTPDRQARRLRYAPWIGMAATLLLGVGIGRYAMDRGPASVLRDPAFTVDSRSAAIETSPPEAPLTDVAQAPDATPESRTPGDRLADGLEGVPADRSVGRPTATRAVAQAPAQAPVPAPGEARVPAVSLDGAGRTPNALSPTYEVASQRHLQRAEALVAVVAATPRDPMMDSLTSLWARDVLTNTRLMLDSPVGDDPIRRRLLEDLENLLVQLVQRSGSAVEERALIDRTLRRTQLLTRLRTSASGT